VLVVALALGLAGPPLGCASKRPPGVVHTVQKGENLYRIGLRYGVDAKEIARANGIRDVRELRPGQRLFIPGARRRPGGSSAPGNMARAQPDARSRPQASSPSRSSLRFRWPVRGRLSSRFGARRGRPHEGIDIAASRGTPIFAAEAGRVIQSGRMRGYGKVVIVKHAGAYRTIYAHANRLFVRKGQFVERGQKIAEVGSTGRSSGPHLHFEIRQRERPRDPMAYLP
jgi:murein DD-endopeptidase MepM/ murein hydrolase activator NlpD